MTNLVNRGVPEPGNSRTEERVLLAIDGNDRVLVVAAIERHVPPRPRVSEREVEPGVPHLADVDNRRSRLASGGRQLWIEQQVVGVTPVGIDYKIQIAVEQYHVGADVLGTVFFPLHVWIPQRRLSVARSEVAA